MSGSDIPGLLLSWTPYLLGGFAWNIAISLAAMAIGTAAGYMLALGRASRHTYQQRTAILATALMRNVPTFVFQFYLVFMLPDTVPMPLGLGTVAFPSWLKASLALASAVAGLVSDNLGPVLDLEGSERHQALMRFALHWSNYLVIIVMASSTASVIGVSELVSRCNTVVNASGTTDMMLWVYLYAMAFFFTFCLCSTRLIGAISRHVSRREILDIASRRT